MRKVYVRADGSETIGMGHLMRMMTIADQMKRDADILFLCARSDSRQILEERGFQVRVLNSNPTMLDESEIPAICKVLQEDMAPSPEEVLFLVDSYYVMDDYLLALAKYGRVFLMDDLMSHVYPVDGIINYNGFADSLWYERHYPNKRRYIGPRYVPLRPDFRKEGRGRTQEGEGILITTGGSDHLHIGSGILYRLFDMAPERTYHLVLGPLSGEDQDLLDFAKDRPNIKLHRNVRDMAGLMRECILGVTAGGSTVYEMCAIGLPMLVFSYAENQEMLAKLIGERKAGAYLGMYHRDPREVFDNLDGYFPLALREKSIRLQWREQAFLITDGQGAGRLAKELLRDCIL